MNPEIIARLNKEFDKKNPREVLEFFIRKHHGRITLANSMGVEDQVLTDMVMKIDKSVPVFTLDTGRMFPETYDLIARTNEHYGTRLNVFFPDNGRVEEMVNSKGINLFYESTENRKLCCHIRKIEPLKRALKGMDVWITGLRREQSVTRLATDLVEWDEGNGLIKLNPLADWIEQQVWDYIREHNVPYHALHDQGFPSIGCQPCTRSVKPGDDVRSGRWWWENPESKECGLHNRPNKTTSS
jgi:phosphoadenosine phosphosulfate reductase